MDDEPKMKRRFWLFALVILAASAGQTEHPAEAEAIDGVQAILAAFAEHDVVFLAEHHGDRLSHAFFRKLIRHPAFAVTVDDVYLEAGNHLYQDIADRYFLKDAPPPDGYQAMWRNTTQPGTWDSALYTETYGALRAVNLAKPAEERVRVILADPPIAWDKVETPEDFAPFLWSRDTHLIARLEADSLAQNRKALVFIGGGHFISPNLVAAGVTLKAWYPARVFRVWGFFAPEPGDVLGQEAAPGDIIIACALEAVPFANVDPHGVGPASRQEIPKVVDAVLYWGEAPDLVPKDPPSYEGLNAAQSKQERMRRQQLLEPPAGPR